MAKVKVLTYIPSGYYCYNDDGICPHWSINKEYPHQYNGYCSFLKRGDWEAEIPPDFPPNLPTSCISLIWDKVKECHVNIIKGKPHQEDYQ